MQTFGTYAEVYLFSHIPYAYIKTNRKLVFSIQDKGLPQPRLQLDYDKNAILI